MKRRKNKYVLRNALIKFIALLLIVSSCRISITNASFSSQKSSRDNLISTGCWATPSVPSLLYPENYTFAGLASAWNLNPYMDWSDSTTTCPLTNPISYQYESYRDSGLTILAYRSGWLNSSQIPAWGTPEGKYYWRVRAKDSFLNTSDFSSAWLLTVDRTAPVSTFTQPLSNINVVDPSISISGSSTDAYGVDKLTLLYTDYSGTSCGLTYTEITTINNPANNTPFNWNYSWTPSTASTYCIKAEATDLAGNKEASPVVENIRYLISQNYSGNVADEPVLNLPTLTLSPTPTEIPSVTPTPDPSPTQALVVQPLLAVSVSSDNRLLSFSLTDISEFTKLNFEINYDTDLVPQGIMGEVLLDHQNDYNKTGIVLGTCSTGGTCIYHGGIKNLILKVNLFKADGSFITIQKSP